MFRMDLFMANLVNYPHVLRVISRQVTFVEDDVMALNAFASVQRLTAHCAAIALSPGEPVIFRMQACLCYSLPAPLPVRGKAGVVW
jgi:hypothetical protein